ncbi:hypothetical protein KIN20_014985 [Parelaphostrongylus tenuis]|uniref:Uncharacterized protein n=1 Tax=Parelaphostrongylus tenuis TaxID=148309 RepID=A0AAD5MWP1_PARTN|nr:hypothetical protein KIN20_014985 [Parelaphostrongylus tenuis]
MTIAKLSLEDVNVHMACFTYEDACEDQRLDSGFEWMKNLCIQTVEENSAAIPDRGCMRETAIFANRMCTTSAHFGNLDGDSRSTGTW